jgi:hypothetical protein
MSVAMMCRDVGEDFESEGKSQRITKDKLGNYLRHRSRLSYTYTTWVSSSIASEHYLVTMPVRMYCR